MVAKPEYISTGLKFRANNAIGVRILRPENGKLSVAHWQPKGDMIQSSPSPLLRGRKTLVVWISLATVRRLPRIHLEEQGLLLSVLTSVFSIVAYRSIKSNQTSND
ncbi:hypothetical protein DFP73DRAFT_583657, partial [Morchella snyderi]